MCWMLMLKQGSFYLNIIIIIIMNVHVKVFSFDVLHCFYFYVFY